MEKLLEIKDLKVNFNSYGGDVQAVRWVNLLRKNYNMRKKYQVENAQLYK